MYLSLSLSTCIALLVAALSFVFATITRGTGLLSSTFDMVTALALAVVIFKAVQAGIHLCRHHILLRAKDTGASGRYPLAKARKTQR